MVIALLDWKFEVDIGATWAHTTSNADDHCLCAYCKNYYETVDREYPQLVVFLRSFGIDFCGPSELMPFTPTLMLACYRVQGKILQWGTNPLLCNGIPILPEAADRNSFFLWVGELELPWLQAEAMEEVVSPANLPEFLERMQDVWLLRHGEEIIFS